jgi:hypothetical protein
MDGCQIRPRCMFFYTAMAKFVPKPGGKSPAAFLTWWHRIIHSKKQYFRGSYGT